MSEPLRFGDPEPYVLAGATRRTFESTGELQGRWVVSVSMPHELFAARAPFPTLYVVDPGATFATTAHLASITSMLSTGALAPLAVVGIGPASDDLGQLMVQRIRDLTPTVWHHPALGGMDGMGTGGAGAFLDLLVDQVIPALEAADDRLDPNDRAIGGWSLGGLFACLALLERPATFKRYLAVSPSLWWHDRVLVDGGRVGAADLAGREVYLAVGEHESERAVDRAWPPPSDAARAAMAGIDMPADLRSFAALLRERGDVVVHEDVIADESHSTVWPAAVMRGLVRLYGAG